MMKIGILIQRDAMYKFFGPIIEEALKRGHEVFCLHDYGHSRDGQKGYAFPSIEKTPLFRAGVVSSIPFYNKDELFKIIKENKIQALTTIAFTAQYIDLRDKLKKAGVLWIALQHAFDILVFAKYLDIPDKYLIYSDIWLDWALYYLADNGGIKEEEMPAYKEKLKNNVKSVGVPEMDQKNIIEAIEVRKEWGIPEGKPVVLYLPFPFGSGKNCLWTNFIYGMNNPILQLPIGLISFRWHYVRQILNRWNDKSVFEAVKKFCKNNNAYLLVKSRLKDPVKKYIHDAADKVIYDEEYYPATTMKCFSIANICINFLSSAVVESAYNGIPNVCISPPPQDYANIWGKKEVQLWKTIFKRANQFFDFKGVSYLLNISQSIKLLSTGSLKDFPFYSVRQNEYIEKFIGESDRKYQYSAKVLDEIEKMVNE